MKWIKISTVIIFLMFLSTFLFSIDYDASRLLEYDNKKLIQIIYYEKTEKVKVIEQLKETVISLKTVYEFNQKLLNANHELGELLILKDNQIKQKNNQIIKKNNEIVELKKNRLELIKALNEIDEDRIPLFLGEFHLGYTYNPLKQKTFLKSSILGTLNINDWFFGFINVDVFPSYNFGNDSDIFLGAGVGLRLSIEDI